MYLHGIVPTNHKGTPCPATDPMYSGTCRVIHSHNPGDTVVYGEGKRAKRYVVMGDRSLRRLDKLSLGR